MAEELIWMISYHVLTSSKLVQQLSKCKVRANVKIWTSEANIMPSDDWRSSIDATVMQADRVILLISEGWLNSKECQYETKLALSLRNKKGYPEIVPVVFPGVDTSNPVLVPILANFNGVFPKTSASDLMEQSDYIKLGFMPDETPATTGGNQTTIFGEILPAVFERSLRTTILSNVDPDAFGSIDKGLKFIMMGTKLSMKELHLDWAVCGDVPFTHADRSQYIKNCGKVNLDVWYAKIMVGKHGVVLVSEIRREAVPMLDFADSIMPMAIWGNKTDDDSLTKLVEDSSFASSIGSAEKPGFSMVKPIIRLKDLLPCVEPFSSYKLLIVAIELASMIKISVDDLNEQTLDIHPKLVLVALMSYWLNPSMGMEVKLLPLESRLRSKWNEVFPNDVERGRISRLFLIGTTMSPLTRMTNKEEPEYLSRRKTAVLEYALMLKPTGFMAPISDFNKSVEFILKAAQAMAAVNRALKKDDGDINEASQRMFAIV